MSHFVVLVTGDNIDDQMAPFEERPSDPSYLEFEDETEELKHKWDNETTEMVRIGKGRLVFPWDDEAKKGGTKVMASFKEMYKDFETFAREYSGAEYSEEHGGYGHFHNPNAKWDWYQVGGRWSEFFLLKQNNRNKKADIVLKRDVDWDKMRSGAAREAEAVYAKYLEATNGINPPVPWKKFSKRYKSIETARKRWHSHPWVQALRVAGLDGIFIDQHEYFFVGDKDAEKKFVDRAKRRAFSTYAILHEGEWMQKGEMGWFGMSSDEMSEGEWLDRVNAFIEGLPDDTRLTIVDCHI